MFCTRCGNKNEEGTKFCVACGNPLNTEIMGQVPNQATTVTPMQQANGVSPVQTQVAPVQQMNQATPVQPQVTPVQQMNQAIPVQPQVRPVQQMNQAAPMQPAITPIQPMNGVAPMRPVNPGQPVYQAPMQPMGGYVPPRKKSGMGAFALLGLVAVVGLVIFLASNGIGGGGTKKRTMMIYISASNLESEVAAVTSDLNSIIPSRVDLDNMNVVIYAGGTKLWHNEFSANENAIYELTKSGLVKKKSYQTLNMSLPTTLSDFLNYAYKNYKAEKYDLIIYSHGGAWQGAITDDHYEGSFMQLPHFKQAFSTSPFNSANKLEGIIFRTCLNGNYEVATVLKDYADYMVASEEMTLGGSSIHVLDFLNDITGDMDFITVGNKFAESYYNNTANTAVVKASSEFRNMVMAYATVDLSNMAELEREVGSFFEGINVNTNYYTISRVRNGLYQYAMLGGEPAFDVIDLYKLVDNLKDKSTYNSSKLLSTFNKVVVNCYTNSIGKNNSKCMSIYFPYRADKSMRESFVAYYEKQNFDPKYGKFIKDFNFKLASASTSSAMLQLDNGHFKNNISIANKILKLNLADDEKEDIISVKYHVFEKKGDKYQEIKYGDNVILNGNDLTINLGEGYIMLKDSYIYTDYTNESYRAHGYLAKEGEVKDTDAVTYGFDENGKLVSATKKSKTDKSVSMALLNLADYGKYYFSSYSYNFGNKVDSKWKETVTEEKLDFAKDDVETKITNLENGDYYVMLEVYDTNNNVHYTSLNKIK